MSISVILDKTRNVFPKSEPTRSNVGGININEEPGAITGRKLRSKKVGRIGN